MGNSLVDVRVWFLGLHHSLSKRITRSGGQVEGFILQLVLV